MKNKISYTIQIFVLALVFFIAFPVTANTLYIDPISKNVSPGSDFVAKVKVGDLEECINSIDLGVKFPSDKLKFKDFSGGDSILSLWIKKPNSTNSDIINNKSEVRFSGGIPGGYCGDVLGEVGENNILGEIVFHVLDNAKGNIELKFSDNSLILANDGIGTKVNFDKKTSNLTINNNAHNKDSWSEKIKNDKTSPEPFLVNLDRNNHIHNGKYFLIFSTTDKQTGVDRYEVLEVDKKNVDKYQSNLNIWDKFLNLFSPKRKEAKWIVTSSPYLIKDQSLNSIVKVRAIDKAGNYREAVFDNGVYNDSGRDKYLYVFGVFAIIAVLSIIITVIFLKFKK